VGRNVCKAPSSPQEKRGEVYFLIWVERDDQFLSRPRGEGRPFCPFFWGMASDSLRVSGGKKRKGRKTLLFNSSLFTLLSRVREKRGGEKGPIRESLSGNSVSQEGGGGKKGRKGSHFPTQIHV